MKGVNLKFIFFLFVEKCYNLFDDTEEYGGCSYYHDFWGIINSLSVNPTKW